MYSRIAANKRNTVFLMVFMFLFVLGLGLVLSWLFAGDGWIGWFAGVVVVVTVATFVQVKTSGTQFLQMVGAVEINPQDPAHDRLWRIVQNVCITAGIPFPRVYVIEDSYLNAFASGSRPEKALVGVTTGLLNELDDMELEGVIAHEVSHIKNYDVRLSTALFAFSAALLFTAEIFMRARGGKNNPLPLVGFALFVVAYPIVLLGRLAVSRQREYLADVSAVELTRYPDGLRSALVKIDSYGVNGKVYDAAASHMFFHGKTRSRFANLFATHPPMADRIKRVESSMNSF